MVNKIIILLSVIVGPLVAGDFWKQEWSKNFKNREDFVAHLRAEKRESVRAYILRRSQEREAKLFGDIIKSFVKDTSEQKKFLARFQKFNTYKEPENTENNGIHVHLSENFNDSDGLYIVQLLKQHGYSGEIAFLIDFSSIYDLAAGIDTISFNDGTSRTLNVLIFDHASQIKATASLHHEIGHIMLQHAKKKIILRDDLQVLKNYPSLYKKFQYGQEFSADDFSASLSPVMAQERAQKYSQGTIFDETEHPPATQRCKNAIEIKELLEAEEAWWRTPKAAVWCEEQYNIAEYRTLHKQELKHRKKYWQTTAFKEMNNF